MQKDKVYVMDVAGVNKICNGTFNDSKVFTRVRLIKNCMQVLMVQLYNMVYVYLNNSLI